MIFEGGERLLVGEIFGFFFVNSWPLFTSYDFDLFTWTTGDQILGLRGSKFDINFFLSFFVHFQSLSDIVAKNGDTKQKKSGLYTTRGS